MPTLDWIRETAEDRYWESQPLLRPKRYPDPTYECPHCRQTFSSNAERRRHLGLVHPHELPILVVHGKPLAEESLVRIAVDQSEVEVLNSSKCVIQIDGGPWREVDESAFRSLFSQATNSTWNVRLVHERPEDRSHVASSYRVQFLIPSIEELNSVDGCFIKALVVDEIRHLDLERFQAALPDTSAAQNYGRALGDYALGVLLKEFRNPFYAPIDFAEFETKMRTALDTLRHFHRPVALAVTSSVRFNLNDFHDYGAKTATDLDVGLRFFRTISDTLNCSGQLTVDDLAKRIGSPHKICPIDGVTHQLLKVCGYFVRDGTVPLDRLETLRQFTRSASPVSEQDLVKIHVICAEGYRRLGRAADASLHFREIEYNSMFGYWARRELKEM